MESNLDKILNGDSELLLEGMTLPPRTFVVIDPPFGLPGEDFDQVLRVLTALKDFPQVIILDWRNSHRVPMTKKVGELVWEYGWVSGGRTRAKCGFFPTHNTVHLLGQREDFRFISGSIIHRQPGFSSPRQCSFAKKSGHPYEKPVPLMEHLISGCLNAELILDPFAGSGSTLVAAKRSGVSFLGIEKDPDWVAVAEKRLDEAAAKGERRS